MIAALVLVAVIILAAALGNHLPGQSNPAPITPTRFELWSDKTEGAFSIVLPNGWTATGGVRRPYIDADFFLNATDPSGTMGLGFYYSFESIVEPSPNRLECQLYPGSEPYCSDGNWWNVGLYRIYVYHFLTAPDYINQRLLPFPTQTGVSDVRIVGTIKVRPDLAGSSGNAIMGNEHNGADVVLSYTMHGVPYRAGVTVLVGRTTILDFSIWQASFAYASAPESSFDAVSQFYQTCIPTVTLNTAWVQTEIQNQRQRSEMIQKAFDNIMQMQYRMFVELSDSNERIGRAWANVLGGYGGEA